MLRPDANSGHWKIQENKIKDQIKTNMIKKRMKKC